MSRFPSILLLAMSCPMVLASEGPATKPVMDYTVPAAPGGTLEVELGSGGTLHVLGWNEPRVLVRARLAGRDWRATSVSLRPVSVGARLRTSLAGSRDELSTSHAFEVRVPRSYDLEIHSSGGDIQIEGVEGEFRGGTDGGSIVLARVRGEASLATRGGNVEITDSHLEGRVTTRGGAVRLSHVTGGVEAGLDDDVDRETKRAGVRRVDLRGGPIEIDEVPSGAVLRTGAGRISVLRARGSVDANTGYGDIEIGPTSGPVRAITGTGDIHVTIVRNLAGSEAVELTSGLGAVTLDLPSDFDGVLDLRTGSTESFGRATQIECDWNLEIERTGLLENGGTPQRYAIGRAAVGRGSSRVVIRTTNGDIVVRRSRAAGARPKLKTSKDGTSFWLPFGYRFLSPT